MSNAKGSFSKFVLRPSSLSQHTANFNKILEQAPILHTAESLDLKASNNSNLKEHLEASKTDNKEQLNPNNSGEEFIFGEKLSDRVINTESAEKSVDFAPAVNDSSNSLIAKTNLPLINKSFDNEDENTNDDSNSATNNYENENDQEFTMLKINCKLYLLDVDKKIWLERGYGIFKVIETNDKANCKLMMWTDKCYRLILNTKLFENMSIDKANKKSIRFSGYDSGSVKNFLVKTANTNDCDELYGMIKSRVDDLRIKSSNKEFENGNELEELKFECKISCENLNIDSNNSELVIKVNQKINSIKNLVIVIKSATDIELELNLNRNSEEIEIRTDIWSFFLYEDDKKYTVVLTDEEFKKFLTVLEKDFIAHKESSDTSNNQDELIIQKTTAKRGAETELNTKSDKLSGNCEDTHSTKKPKISKNE